MNIEDQLHIAKCQHEQFKIDGDHLKKIVFKSIKEDAPSVQTRWFSRKAKKTSMIGVSLLILPLAGFTAAHYRLFHWGNIQYDFHDNMNYSLSQMAIPWEDQYLTFVKQHAKKINNITQALASAMFPIREPKSITGWDKIVSEGIIWPMSIHKETNNHKWVTVENNLDSPLTFLDVYQNKEGKRVSIEQQSFQTSTEHKNPNVNIDFANQGKILSGFNSDLAVLFTDNNLSEIQIYHNESDGSVTKIVLDGNVIPSTLESIAHDYLQEPPK